MEYAFQGGKHSSYGEFAQKELINHIMLLKS